MDQPGDPKGEAGRLKCPLHLLPPVGMEEAAWAHLLGAEKYGAWNWRDTKVRASVYVAAAMRHLNAWRDGQDNDHESGRSHLGHAMACFNIILDAKAHGTLIDDRAGRGPLSSFHSSQD